MEKKNIEKCILDWNTDNDFSGVISVVMNNEPLLEKACGYANRSDEISNTADTRFAIASGTKIFTGLAVCQLVEMGLLSFETLLKDCVEIHFPHYDPGITIHHLLTHSSGITSYFEEDINPDYEALWQDIPMYKIRSPKDFLPLFQNKPMKFRPGERYEYNDGGYILLGMVIEAVTGKSYPDYVRDNILLPAGMTDSGFFLTDQLPQRTAYGYMKSPQDNSWRTNFFSVPIIGGPDGGMYATACDMNFFWIDLLQNKLLSESLTRKLFYPHIEIPSKRGDIFYGYGVYIVKRKDQTRAFFITGEDPGVDFLSAVYPDHGLKFTVMANTNKNPWPLFEEINSFLS